MRLLGADICPEAVEQARRAVPGAKIECLDLYEVETWPDEYGADVVLSLGVLSHCEPTSVPGIVQALARRARMGVLFVEHFSAVSGQLLKGPASWRPALKATGPYLLWTVSAEQIMGHGDEILIPLPEDLQSPGATAALLVDRGLA